MKKIIVLISLLFLFSCEKYYYTTPDKIKEIKSKDILLENTKTYYDYSGSFVSYNTEITFLCSPKDLINRYTEINIDTDELFYFSIDAKSQYNHPFNLYNGKSKIKDLDSYYRFTQYVYKDSKIDLTLNFKNNKYNITIIKTWKYL